MIYAIMLLFAATVGALIGIFCVTATASGEKYDGELYEHDRQILMRRRLTGLSARSRRFAVNPRIQEVIIHAAPDGIQAIFTQSDCYKASAT